MKWHAVRFGALLVYLVGVPVICGLLGAPAAAMPVIVLLTVAVPSALWMLWGIAE